MTRVENDGRAKVDQLDLEVVRDDNVFILDVSMADSDLTKCVDDFDDLCENVLRSRVVKSTMLLDASVEKEIPLVQSHRSEEDEVNVLEEIA